MNEKPIIFSTDMVRAILDGRKTQTRRIIKPQPIQLNSHKNMIDSIIKKMKIKYSDIGCKLWVRETFCDMALIGTQVEKRIIYKASNDKKPDWAKWKPSIFMPRKASRINLEITGLRIERLQKITEDDAIAEGCFPGRKIIENGKYVNELDKSAALIHFEVLWDSINEKRGYGWSTNPYVCVIEFKKV